MSTIVMEPPVEVEQAADGGEHYQRYCAIAECLESKFVCVYWLNADDEQDCRNIIIQDFLRRGKGTPTKFTLHLLSEEIDDFNVGSNDEDVRDFVHMLTTADFLE